MSTGDHLGTADWSPDDSQVAFLRDKGGVLKLFAVNADGSHLREIPSSLAVVDAAAWSRDGKDIYASGHRTQPYASVQTVRLSADGSGEEPLAENCGIVLDASRDGQYVLTSMLFGEKVGIFEISTAEKKCGSLVPNVVSFSPHLARDGKSIVFAISARGEVVLYRLPWLDGKATGNAQEIVKLPFAFAQSTGGNDYDIARDLSKIVYVRPGGQFDVYHLSQK